MLINLPALTIVTFSPQSSITGSGTIPELLDPYRAIMVSLKRYHTAPRNYLLHGLVASVVLVSAFVFTRGPIVIATNLSENDYRTVTKAVQHSDLSRNNDPRRDKPCLSYIFYDKPVKTGSTSVEKALLNYISSVGETISECGSMVDCAAAAEEVCLGIRPPGHLVHHLRINASRVSCLHDRGFYHVTSIRDPKERILSSFKFNRATRKGYGGIDPDAPFEVFLEKFPRCGLFNYYDGLGTSCGSDKQAIIDRAENIANRMDEVIELTEEPTSDLHRRIGRFIKHRNVVILKGANATEYQVSDEAAEAETVLYSKLKERKEALARQPKRILCDKTPVSSHL